MDKEDVVFTHNRILFSYKKKQWNLSICDNIDLEGVTLSAISQRKTNTVWFPLHMESKKHENKQNKPETDS